MLAESSRICIKPLYSLRWRLRACICIATSIASQLLFTWSPTAAGSPKKQLRTASIIQQVDGDNPWPAVWCYDTGPAFVFSDKRTLFRYDASGKLIWQTSVPWDMGAIGEVSCSPDGKILYSPGWFRTRLSIYSPDNGLSEYEVPKLKSNIGSIMSPDGSTFALPSAPSIISGNDVLRDKRIVQTGGEEVFWTKDILFVRVGKKNSYRMLRTGDLSEVGVLNLQRTPDVHGIFECGKTYFVLYWKEQLQRRDLEWINDRRLQPDGARTRFENVGAVDQSDRFCTVSLYHLVRGLDQVATVSILQDRFQERIDLRNIKDLAAWLKVSRDRRYILGTQQFEKPTGALDPWTGLPKPNDTITATRVVVIGIER